MATLDVQRKPKSPLPWILLTLLILGLVGYFLWRQYGGDKTLPATTDSTNNIGVDTTTNTLGTDTTTIR